MNDIIATSVGLDQIPGEDFLLSCLQKPISFSINNKVLKKGRLLLFRRAHYFIQVTLQTEKSIRENIEIPIPFKVENYEEDGLMYFDYRLGSLNVSFIPKLPEKVPSVYFNKILEIAAV